MSEFDKTDVLDSYEDSFVAWKSPDLNEGDFGSTTTSSMNNSSTCSSFSEVNQLAGNHKMIFSSSEWKLDSTGLTEKKDSIVDDTATSNEHNFDSLSTAFLKTCKTTTKSSLLSEMTINGTTSTKPNDLVKLLDLSEIELLTPDSKKSLTNNPHSFKIKSNSAIFFKSNDPLSKDSASLNLLNVAFTKTPETNARSLSFLEPTTNVISPSKQNELLKLLDISGIEPLSTEFQTNTHSLVETKLDSIVPSSEKISNYNLTKLSDVSSESISKESNSLNLLDIAFTKTLEPTVTAQSLLILEQTPKKSSRNNEKKDSKQSHSMKLEDEVISLLDEAGTSGHDITSKITVTVSTKKQIENDTINLLDISLSEFVNNNLSNDGIKTSQINSFKSGEDLFNLSLSKNDKISEASFTLKINEQKNPKFENLNKLLISSNEVMQIVNSQFNSENSSTEQNIEYNKSENAKKKHLGLKEGNVSYLEENSLIDLNNASCDLFSFANSESIDHIQQQINDDDVFGLTRRANYIESDANEIDSRPVNASLIKFNGINLIKNKLAVQEETDVDHSTNIPKQVRLPLNALDNNVSDNNEEKKNYIETDKVEIDPRKHENIKSSCKRLTTVKVSRLRPPSNFATSKIQLTSNNKKNPTCFPKLVTNSARKPIKSSIPMIKNLLCSANQASNSQKSRLPIPTSSIPNSLKSLKLNNGSRLPTLKRNN